MNIIPNEIYDISRFRCVYSTVTKTVCFHDIKNNRYYDPVTKTFFDSLSYFRFLDDLTIFEPYQKRSPESMVGAMKHQFKKFNAKKYVIPYKFVKKKCSAQIRYESLEGTDADKMVPLYIPILLTDDMIHKAMIDYKEKYDANFEYNLEIAKAFIGLVAFTYLFQKTKRTRKVYITDKEFFSNHFKSFVQLRSNYIEQLVGYTFESYRLAYINAGLLLCDDKWYHYEDSKKARSYKLSNELFTTDSSTIDVKQYYIFHVQDWRLKYNFAADKIRIRNKRKMTDANYKQMINDATELFMRMDISEMRSSYDSNPYDYYGLSFGDDKGLKKKLKDKDEIKIDEFINTVEFIQQGNTYFNVCDKFGGRFHSIFTNIKSWIRQFINYDGVKYISADAKNSQMAIFSRVLQYPDNIANMMHGTEWTKAEDDDSILLPFDDVITCVKHSKQHSDDNKQDLDKFVELSNKGLLYEEIACIIKKDRESAKNCVFKTFFSNDIQFKDLKNKLSTEFPTMVGLVSYLNQQNYVPHLPKLLQKVESEIFVNRIYRRFSKEKKYPAITIHDSLMFHPDDLELFNRVYNEVFEELGIPPMALRFDDYNKL